MKDRLEKGLLDGTLIT
ncbi:Protein of unknown function [Lactobacillus helveticus CIRM-BIA 104]|uniref:Uncharacterized protein n=1 Tax=Lactobacillus helveticus CIRM-BIA 104 TaxID=1226333 RepID=U6FF35_LACHE|nr:Protein of unknown function [Lactobacillus helveticus CIRM-BIA 104]